MDDAEERLVAAAADLTAQSQSGQHVPYSAAMCLRAEAMTREQTVRHRLAAEAQQRAEQRIGEIGSVALQLLRVAIFALA